MSEHRNNRRAQQQQQQQQEAPPAPQQEAQQQQQQQQEAPPAPQPPSPEALGHVLTIPRYVSHRAGWTRNAAPRIVVGVEAGAVVLSRDLTPTEKGEGREKDGTAIPRPIDPVLGAPAMVAPPALMDGGRVRLALDPMGLGNPDAVVGVLVAVMVGAGLGAISATEAQRGATVNARKAEKALAAKYDGGILDALGVINDPARSDWAVVFWGGENAPAMQYLAPAALEGYKPGARVLEALGKAEKAAPPALAANVRRFGDALRALIPAPQPAPQPQPGTGAQQQQQNAPAPV